MRFGSPHRHYRRTDSTNDRARDIAAAGAPSGTVVTADEQTAGRGRHDRTWSAPVGKALLHSGILRPLEERHKLLPLAVPLAVCDAVERIAPFRCQVKWPNDVWLDERKVAGVLIEARFPDWAVIGVGVNIAIREEDFPSELRWPAISVMHDATVESALRALNVALGEWVDADPERVLIAYRERDALRGRSVSWEGGSGIAEGIDEQGNLVVIGTEGERTTLGSGEVSLTSLA